MNANTACKIREAIDQAVWCGESVPEIVAHVTTALLDAERRLVEARIKEAQANLEQRGPEGLHFDRGTSEFRDAQEHVWVTIHPAAMGDPEAWRKEIVARIKSALLEEGK